MSKRVYLAGPIAGFSYSEARYGWRADLAVLLNTDIEVLSPMRQEGHLAEVTEKLTGIPYDGNLWSKGRTVVTKDLFDVKRSDIVVVYVKNTKNVSIGTITELGWASALGKPIILIIEDDAEKNPHHHMFLYELANIRVDNIQDAAQAINGLLSHGI